MVGRHPRTDEARGGYAQPWLFPGPFLEYPLMSSSAPSPQAQPNDSSTNDWFKVRGAYLRLPWNYQAESQPDWRVAMFSVVLPVSELPSTEQSQVHWLAGRFKGLKKVQYAGENADATGFEVKKWNGKGDDFKYIPRSFHKGAYTYFRRPLKHSVGAYAVDAIESKIGPDGSWESGNTTNPTKFCAKRVLFDADLTAESGAYDFPDTGQPKASKALFALGDDEAHPYASVRLMCAELLSYDGPNLTSTDFEQQGQLHNNFVVLHVAAENCSDAMLEQVTASLSRPRNVVGLLPSPVFKNHDRWKAEELEVLRDAASKNDKAYCKEDSAEVSLLELFVRVTEKTAQPQSEPGGAITIEAGGYQSTREGEEARSVKPYTISMAIPGAGAGGAPSIIDAQELPADSPWCVHDLWAWYLSSMYDEYNTAIPNFDEDALRQSQAAKYQTWTVHSSEHGLSFVRRQPLDNKNNNFMMLASTRFVDLAILVRRAENYLLTMSQQLRTMNFGLQSMTDVQATALNEDGEMDSQTLKAQNELREGLRTFGIIQTELVYFRDHLWYERVSGREVATTVLQHMLEKTGTRRSFDDVEDEIALRKDVYSTLAQDGQIAIDALKAEQAKEKQEQQDTANFVLAVVATVLAVPGFLDLFPNLDVAWRIGIGLFLIAALVCFFYLWLRPREKKRPRLRKRKNTLGVNPGTPDGQGADPAARDAQRDDS